MWTFSDLVEGQMGVICISLVWEHGVDGCEELTSCIVSCVELAFISSFLPFLEATDDIFLRERSLGLWRVGQETQG